MTSCAAYEYRRGFALNSACGNSLVETMMLKNAFVTNVNNKLSSKSPSQLVGLEYAACVWGMQSKWGGVLN
jgi:hypothetical protein